MVEEGYGGDAHRHPANSYEDRQEVSKGVLVLIRGYPNHKDNEGTHHKDKKGVDHVARY